MPSVKCKYCKREGFKFRTHGKKSKIKSSLEHKSNCSVLRKSKQYQKKKKKNGDFQ